MDYYDIDSILSENQKVPCTSTVSIPGLGHEGRMVPTGSKVELPFWLAEVLAINSFVSIHMPAPFSSVVRNALKANPNSVSIRDITTHYYHFAEKMLHLISDDSLVQISLNTLRSRAMLIADASLNPQGALQQNSQFIEGLDDFEKHILRVSHNAHRSLINWQNSTS
ncbi:DNA replication complex GINS protein psf3 [Schizosaccharomyces pombe]|uniref:DNA replication complex GINS protein psf3 n=1 Tax=Schizosaccharomyces pombe (strain 972 / ATCC 24843) TaxID=284812 RepID=PSF3_SCHPO|nr:GINS complex subunit Psf3 [Schizosaccharomyces pombe]Q9UTC3.1 RecName: Full=DNA replication complex GINS protein psf3 [Schizosaccharomyces pombe 972h-]CAB61465.1 GINS complex subunit Psf3 [Schizosaccharomyces pombe]|eukprot:NP_592970.1 GINS complex subunit Psf3 [Schizosaccharomyces pombe]